MEHTCPLPRADFPATGRGIHPLVCRVSAWGGVHLKWFLLPARFGRWRGPHPPSAHDWVRERTPFQAASMILLRSRWDDKGAYMELLLFIFLWKMDIMMCDNRSPRVYTELGGHLQQRESTRGLTAYMTPTFLLLLLLLFQIARSVEQSKHFSRSVSSDLRIRAKLRGRKTRAGQTSEKSCKSIFSNSDKMDVSSQIKDILDKHPSLLIDGDKKKVRTLIDYGL